MSELRIGISMSGSGTMIRARLLDSDQHIYASRVIEVPYPDDWDMGRIQQLVTAVRREMESWLF